MRKIIDFDQAKVICGRNFWEKKFPEENCFSKYLHAIKSIKETTLKVLLFKIFHNIFPTKILLKKWNVVDSDLCTCGAKDFIEHALVECKLLDQFWKEVEGTIFESINKRVSLTTANKIFGFSQNDSKELNISIRESIILNNVLILAKFVINKTKALGRQNFQVTFEFEWAARKNKILNST